MADVKVNIIAEDSFSSVLGNFGSIMTGIESILNLAKKAFDAIVIPIAEFGKESLLTAARVNELAAVNAILAENAGIPAEVIPTLVDAIRKQGIEASVAQTTIANLIRANIDLGLATDIARVAQDAAVISGMNSSETLDNIIYGITTLNPLVLRHAGIIVDLQLAYKEWAKENGRTVESLTTAEKQQIAMNEVLEAGAAIAGAYATAMEEPGKVLRSFPRIFDDIMVSIGQPFQDAFGKVILAGYELAKAFSTTIREGGQFAPFLTEIGQSVSDFVEPFTTLAGNFVDTLQKGLNPIISLAYAFQQWNENDPSPIIQAIVDSLLRLNDGVPFIDAFKGLLADLASQDNPLGAFSGGLLTFITTIENQGLGVAIGNLIDNLIDGIDFPSKISVVVDWITTTLEGKQEQIGAVLGAVFEGALTIALTGIAIATDVFMPLANTIVQSLVIAFRNVNIGEEIWRAVVGDVYVDQSGQDIASHIGRMIIDGWNNFWRGSQVVELGRSIIEGIELGLNIMSLGLYGRIQSLAQSVIDLFKRIFGIASPSTVFKEIGMNIILGLIDGINSMFSTLLTFIGIVVTKLLEPFKPILDLLGIDIGGGGGGTFDYTGGGAGGGVAGTSTLTSANNYYNYYYGPVYFQGTGQTNGGVDCQSPNPALSALGSSLPAMGIG